MEISRIGEQVAKIEISCQELSDCGTDYQRLSMSDRGACSLIRRALSAAYGSRLSHRRVFVEAYPAPDGGALIFAALLGEQEREHALVLSGFLSIDDAAFLARQLPDTASELIKKDGEYILLLFMTEDCDEKRISETAGEFCFVTAVDEQRIKYLREHGEPVFRNALNVLKNFYS